MNPKCKDCNGCCDLVYFGAKRFWHCWLCDIWYDGLNSDLYKVPKETMDKYFWEYGVLSSTVLSTEHNSDK